ncbi:MAG: hypothetical protein ACO25F_12485 [Erythrobacter sp.]
MKARMIVVACLLLGACGQRADLAPLANQALPPAPYGSSERPTAAELLEQETLAAPQRSVELRRRSEERADDPYDLPPE